MSALNALSHMLGITFGFGAMLILVGIGDEPVPCRSPTPFESIELELFAVLDVQNRHQRQNRNKHDFRPMSF